VTLPVDHLSHSQAGCMRDCLRLLQYRYVEKRPRRFQPLNMALGRVVHATAAKDYTHRIERGLYLPDDAILDLAAQAFGTETEGVEWKHEEQGAGDAMDSAISMSRAHHRDVAPTVRPLHVEHRMEARVAGCPVTILGYADVIAETAAGKVIRDTKSSTKEPHGAKYREIVPDARNVAQLATYRIIAAANQEPAVESWLDYVWPQKGGQSLPQKVEITKRDVQLALEDYADLIRVYETGLYPRTGRGTWICKEGKCEYYSECILGVSRAVDL